MSVQYRICFIGLGSIGTRHLRNLHMIAESLKINIVIDALRNTQKILPDDVRALLNKEYYDVNELGRYDIIFINNPSQLHLETLENVHNKAKYFFIEKPVFTQAVDDEKLKHFFEINPKENYYVACPIRHTKIYKEIQKIVKLEEVISARAICSSYLPDWRPNVDYSQLYSAKKESGGVKLDLIHEFDYLYSLFGFPHKHFMYEGKFSSLEIQSADIVSYMGYYPNMLLELHIDYVGRKARREIEIYTNKETYVFDFITSSVSELKSGKVQNFSEDANSKYIDEIKHLLKICLGEVENMNDLSYANNVLAKVTEIKND